MNTETTLVLALILSNVSWMTFWMLTQAQHLRAIQWMIGFRPQTAQAERPMFIPQLQTPVSLIPEADHSINRIAKNGKSRVSPETDMGRVTE